MRIAVLQMAVWFLGAVAAAGAEGITGELLAEAEGRFEKAKAAALEDVDAAREHFRAAGDAYALAAGGVGDAGAALYNAGNAYLMAGAVGEAVYQYREAQVYHPFDPNIAHNLEHARRQVLDAVAVRPSRSVADLAAAGVRAVPVGVRAGLLVAGWWGLFAAVVGMLVWGGRVRWRRVAWVCGAVAVVAGAGLVVEWWVCQGGRDGVVVAEEVVARTGDGEVYPWAFTTPLHAGVEFRLLEERGGWVRVRLWSGDEGWVPVSEVRVVGGAREKNWLADRGGTG